MTFKVTTPSAIPVNILTFITTEADQVEALTKFGGSGLRSLKTPSQTVANRAIPVYPSIAFSDEDDATDYTGDIAPSVYTTAFEGNVQSSDPDTAIAEARIYLAAVKWMAINCDTMLTNTGMTSAALQTLEGKMLPIKSNEQQNDFLQQFQVQVTWLLTAGAYE